METIKNKPLIGKAVGKKKTPNKKKLFPEKKRLSLLILKIENFRID